MPYLLRCATSCENVPLQACLMALCASAKVLISGGVASSGLQRMVTVVLPSCSEKVVVESVCIGQLGDAGWRVMPPCASENDETTTSRAGATISRNTHFPHISLPSGERNA